MIKIFCQPIFQKIPNLGGEGGGEEAVEGDTATVGDDQGEEGQRPPR